MQRKTVEKQQEIMRMVFEFADKNPDMDKDNIWSDYMGLVWTSNAKQTHKAHKYWKTRVTNDCKQDCFMSFKPDYRLLGAISGIR